MTTRFVAPIALMLLPLLAACYRSSGGNFVTYGSNSQNRNCADLIQPATTRDADAQGIVDRVNRATVAARSLHGDLFLSSVFTSSQIPPSGRFPVFEFTAKDKRAATVGFHLYTDEPKAIESDPRGRTFSETELITLDDLILGPSRAFSALQQEYPKGDIGTLVLVREDCRLAWRSRIVIPESAQKRVDFHPLVDNATGQVTLPSR
jgi:hypothetical protein